MRQRTSLVLLILAVCAAMASAQDGERHEVIELAFTASASTDAYTGISMACTFEGTAGEAKGYTLTVGGYWDGGTSWRVRFAPPQSGTYTYTTLSADPGLNKKSGTLQVGPSERRGRLRIDPKYPLYFSWTNGEPYLMIGDTWWGHLLMLSTRSFSDDAWRKSVDTRMQQKFNYAHSVIWYSAGSYINGEPLFFNEDFDRVNPGFFREMDKRIQYASDRDFVIGLLHGWADHNYWNRWSTEQTNRFAQYVINRYGAYPVIWSGIGEYDEGGNADQWEAFADFYRTNDPYRNPVTMHPERDGAMQEEGHIDFYIVQRYSDHFDHAVASRAKGMPYINSEYGYEKSGNEIEVMRNAWRLLMGGSAGLVYGHLSYWRNVAMNELNSTGAGYIKHLADFWTNHGVRYWEFNQFTDLGSGRFQAKGPGGQRVLWVESTGSFSVDLSDMSGEATARWYAAADGTWGESKAISTGGTVTVSPPKENCALLIEPATATAENLPPTAIMSVSAENGVAPLSVSFDAEGASDPDGTISAVSWTVLRDSEAIATDSATKFSYSFADTGTFSVRLVVTDDGTPALRDSVTRHITVWEQQPPVARFTADPMSGDYIFPLTVSFDASASTDENGSIAEYRWDFGDGTDEVVVAEPKIKHTYTHRPHGPAIRATLTVVDNQGAMHSSANNLDIVEKRAVHLLEYYGAATAPFIAGNFSDGSPLASDRLDVHWSDVAPEIEGLVHLVTAQADNLYSIDEQKPLYRIQIDSACIVYALVDTEPGWLATDGWTRVELNGPRADGIQYAVWQKEYDAGTIDLKGSHDSSSEGLTYLFRVLDGPLTVDVLGRASNRAAPGMQLRQTGSRVVMSFVEGLLPTHVAVYDTLGRLIKEFKNPARPELVWNARARESGTYVVRAKFGNQVITKTVRVVK